MIAVKIRRQALLFFEKRSGKLHFVAFASAVATPGTNLTELFRRPRQQPLLALPDRPAR
jgi:hypothetical protein